MTAPHADKMVADYLSRLDDALSNLPTARRREILTEIREHIADAREAVAEEADADVLAILGRVGRPADIAEEARARFGLPARRVGPGEVAALLLIGLSGFGHLLQAGGWFGGWYALGGWALGVVLAWRSPCWTAREKQLGAYLPLAVVLATAIAGPLNPYVDGATFLIGTVLPVAGAAFLMVRLGSWPRVMSRTVTALAAAVVGLAAVLAVSVLVPRSYGFLGSPGGPQLSLAATHCGGFYGTTEYGLGLPARANFSVGVCLDGSRVRRTWGKPDCWASDSRLVVVVFTTFPPCGAETAADGSLIVSMHSTGNPTWWPFTRTVDASWRIRPDGSVQQLSG